MMNNNTYKQTFVMHKHNIYKLCVKYNLCTNCDDDTYNNFFSSNLHYTTNDFESLKKHLYDVANDIHKYSNDDLNNTIDNIMYRLMNECVYTYFKLIDNK